MRLKECVGLHIVSVGDQTVETVTRVGVSPLFLVAHWKGGGLFSQWSLRCGGAGISSWSGERAHETPTMGACISQRRLLPSEFWAQMKLGIS